jgi:DNA-binding NarL/FixJ family response regulator
VSECIGICAGGTVLISRRARSPLQVLVAPIRASTLRLSGKIAVAVFIHDPSRPQGPADTLLRSLHGLTRAECRVALLSSDGRVPREMQVRSASRRTRSAPKLRASTTKLGSNDITLVDLLLPGTNGTDTLIAIRGEFLPGSPRLALLCLRARTPTAKFNARCVRELQGNVLKSLPQDELLVVIRSVHGANDMYRLMWQLVSPNI